MATAVTAARWQPHLQVALPASQVATEVSNSPPARDNGFLGRATFPDRSRREAARTKKAKFPPDLEEDDESTLAERIRKKILGGAEHLQCQVTNLSR